MVTRSSNPARWALSFATLLGSWLAMQGVHEFGHVVAARATGATIRRIVWHPLIISRTDLADHPRPLVVAWSGPIVGVVVPLVLLGGMVASRFTTAFLARFFAGFCLIANGAYLGLGAQQRIGDCGDLLNSGAPIWTLWVFGGLAVPIGFWLWHGQSRHFGWDESNPDVNPLALRIRCAACIALILFGLFFGDRGA